MELIIRLLIIAAISFLLLFLSSSNMVKFSAACNPKEREALINFKHHLKDPFDKLLSWVGNDCCNWEGVICKNITEGDVVQLDLQNFFLSGELNSSLLELKYLNYLNLRVNNFTGTQIPAFLGSLHNLRYLNLLHCNLTGKIPPQLGNLSSLNYLDLSENYELEGEIPITFGNLCNLEVLDLSYNKLQGEISSLFTNSSRCSTRKLRLLYLEDNLLSGRLPDELGTLKNLEELLLASNSFSGSIPTSIGRLSLLIFLDLTDNKLTGSLPESFGNLSLELLDLSENHLSGELPDCWFHWRSLRFINLQSNNITGKIPSSIGFLYRLETLRLQNNSLIGEFPHSLRNCTQLRIIDVGENRLTGRIPSWLGESLTRLTALRLRSNEFNGEIPQKLCYLTKLQLMDLGHNNLFGSIPKCFSNFSTMASKRDPNSDAFPSSSMQNSEYTVEFVVKGIDIVYVQSLLKLVAGIDLSSNNLYGEISGELMYLFGLQTLNLSNNLFTGNIPNKIGLLSSLESLDLSNNRLSGSIPQSMVNLTFLGYLNLSCNNLSGEIPLGTQLQSFSELSYIGNHDLCGRPLKNCNEDEQPQKPPYGDGEGSMEDDEDWIEMKWFYMGLPIGFVVGFWCLFGVLLVKKSWRYAYLRFIDDIIYSLCTSLEQKKK